MAASMTKLGYRVHFIDVDRKIKTSKNLQPLLEQKLLSYEELEAPVDEMSLVQRARMGADYKPLKQPKGYLELCERIEALATNPVDAEVVVLDSLTRVNEHLQSLLRYHTKQGKLGFDGWAAVLQNYEALFEAFYRLQPEPYKHAIIICHAKDDRDEVLQAIESRPLIDGSFRDKAGSYVEEMFFTFVEVLNKVAEPKFLSYTKPTGRVMHARTSRDLPVVVESDFSVIFADELEEQDAPAKTSDKRK